MSGPWCFFGSASALWYLSGRECRLVGTASSKPRFVLASRCYLIESQKLNFNSTVKRFIASQVFQPIRYLLFSAFALLWPFTPMKAVAQDVPDAQEAVYRSYLNKTDLVRGGIVEPEWRKLRSTDR